MYFRDLLFDLLEILIPYLFYTHFIRWLFLFKDSIRGALEIGGRSYGVMHFIYIPREIGCPSLVLHVSGKEFYIYHVKLVEEVMK